MVVVEYFSTRPAAESYASTLRGCTTRVNYVRTPVKGYAVTAVYSYTPDFNS